MATFIVWGAIEFVHIRFRRALVAQGQSVDDLPFKAAFYPYGTYGALAANVFLVFFQGKPFPTPYSVVCSYKPGYTAFLNPFSKVDFVTNYILLPVFILLYVVYKFWNKTKWIKLEEMDIWSGRREVVFDDEEAAQRPKKWFGKVKNVVVG